jgi:hypothetical protein
MTEATMIGQLNRENPDLVTVPFAGLATAPPEEGWPAYEAYYRIWGRGYPEIIRKAALSIANNDAVGPWVEARIAAEPYDSSWNNRTYYLLALGSVPATWSARILGRYLFDDRKMITHRDADGDAESSVANPVLAAKGLADMNFSDGPTKGGLFGGIDRGDVEKWQKWWKANEANIEARILQINPGYKPNSQVAGTYATPRPTATPEVVRAIPTPKPTATPALAVQASRADSWFVYLSIGLLAVGIAGIAIAWSLKRQK